MSVATHRQYRVTIILDTRGYDEPVEKLIAHLRQVLTDSGAEVLAENNLGRRDFIRIVDKRHTGDTFLTFDFHGPSSVPEEFRQRTHLDKNVKRVLVEIL